MKVLIKEKEKVDDNIYIQLVKRTQGVMVEAVDSKGNFLANIIFLRHDKRLQRPQCLKIFTKPVEDMIKTW